MQREVINTHYPTLKDGTPLTVEVVAQIEDAECSSTAGNQSVTKKWQEVEYDSITITDHPDPSKVGRVIWYDDGPSDSLEDELFAMLEDDKFNPLEM